MNVYMPAREAEKLVSPMDNYANDPGELVRTRHDKHDVARLNPGLDETNIVDIFYNIRIRITWKLSNNNFTNLIYRIFIQRRGI